MEQTVGALIGSRNTGHVFDPGVSQHVFFGDFGGIAHQTEDVIIGTADQCDRQPLLFEAVNNTVQFSLRRTLFGGNNHEGNLFLANLYIRMLQQIVGFKNPYGSFHHIVQGGGIVQYGVGGRAVKGRAFRLQLFEGCAAL